MRLLYWHTHFLTSEGTEREYRGLTQFEINMSPTDKFLFDRDNRRLTCNKLNQPLPDGFWGGNIFNLNVLTGNNGAGKTTIINYIMDTLHELYQRKITGYDETLFVLEIACVHYLVHLPGSSNYFDLSAPVEIVNFPRGHLPFHHPILDAIDRVKIVYLTNTLSESDDQRVRGYDFNGHIRDHFIYDCSSSGVLRFNEKNDCYANRRGDILSLYFTNEYYKQVKYVCDNIQFSHLAALQKAGKPVPVPKKLYITILNNHHLPTYPNCLLEQKRQAPFDYEMLAVMMCSACLGTFFENLHMKEIPTFLFEHPNNKKLEYLEFEKLFLAILQNAPNNATKNNFRTLSERYLGFIHFVIEKGNRIARHITAESKPSQYMDGNEFTFSLPINQDTTEWLIPFMHLYRRTCSPYYFLDFSWGLSSGENNLLRLFSSLYYLLPFSRCPVKNMPNADSERNSPLLCDTLLLFLDEADLTYHPEWQRLFISILTAFLPKVYKGCEIDDIQVLLSTHSPLLLGDIPKNNVCYLTTDPRAANVDQIETFGQNIHQILKNSFFLSNGTVGAFAEEKINVTAIRLRKINALLKENNLHSNSGENEDYSMIRRELEQCYTVIQLVAPGILKSKLIELYREAASELSEASGEDDKTLSIFQAQRMSREQLEELIHVCQKELDRRERDD